jgi:hypothetical protein
VDRDGTLTVALVAPAPPNRPASRVAEHAKGRMTPAQAIAWAEMEMLEIYPGCKRKR